MRAIALIAATTLLIGEPAAAEDLYTPFGTLMTLPASRNPTDRSITVYHWEFYDHYSDTIPFRLLQVVKPATEAKEYAWSQWTPSVTVVENCPLIPIGDELYRHPLNHKERTAPGCVRLGYTEPEPTRVQKVIAAAKTIAKPVLKKKPKGKGRRPARRS